MEPPAGRSEAKNPTARALLDAAERLVGEQGFARTTTRQITRAAGVNVAAVNYHFGSRRALLEAVAVRAVEPLRDAREERLRQLLAQHGDTPPLADLVRALVVSFDAERGQSGARVLAQVIAERDAGLFARMLEYLRPVDERYQAAVGRAVPELRPPELQWRYLAMVSMLVNAHLLDAIRPPPARSLIGAAADADAREWFVRFVTAGLRAGPDEAQ